MHPPIAGTRPGKEDNVFFGRIKVILAIACGIGVAAGALTYLASLSVPQALLAAGAAVGSSIGLLLQIIGADPNRRASDQKNDPDDQDDRVGRQEA
jgi:hypothetical protein